MQVQKDPPEEWNHRQLYATLSAVYNQPVYNPCTTPVQPVDQEFPVSEKTTWNTTNFVNWNKRKEQKKKDLMSREVVN